MFNLTVETAHTFYVGGQGWLVHNGNTSIWECLGIEPRPINPAYPPNVKATEALAAMPSTDCDYIGCDTLAKKLLEAADNVGTTISIVPSRFEPRKLNLPLEGRITGDWAWHQAYTDGKYVFDPFVSHSPIAKGDYIKLMLKLNPNAMIKFGLDTKIDGPRVEDFIPPSWR